jgi:hypothetical protein
VQAGHAVAEFCMLYPWEESRWSNGTLIYLKVPDEKELISWVDRFDELPEGSYYCATFYEPDFSESLTAVAAVGVDELVKDLPLL